jgi:hypothetical protein
MLRRGLLRACCRVCTDVVADEKKFLSLPRIEPRSQLKWLIKHIYEFEVCKSVHHRTIQFKNQQWKRRLKILTGPTQEVSWISHHFPQSPETNKYPMSRLSIVGHYLPLSRPNDLERLLPLQRRPVLSIIDLHPNQTHRLLTLNWPNRSQSLYTCILWYYTNT